MVGKFDGQLTVVDSFGLQFQGVFDWFADFVVVVFRFAGTFVGVFLGFATEVGLGEGRFQ